MIDAVLASLRPHVAHRVWVLSDLQQSIPAQARRCLTAAVDDVRSLGLRFDHLWYLGDAVEGTRLDHLEEMAAMQLDLLSTFDAPVKYVLGNHDFDHLLMSPEPTGRTAIFRDAVRTRPAWRTTDALEAFYFWDQLGPFTLLFLSDHADPNGRWASTHGKVHGDRARYPHAPAAYRRLRDELAARPGPVITCSHYAFAGGNRPSPLHDQMFPLPDNVRLHLYAHAHIGDAAWAGKGLFRKITAVDDHPLIQCDVASLEDARGTATRSALLEIYHDHSLGLFFRNHTTKRWEEHLLLDANRQYRKPQNT